jgi:hypothetical protein
VPENYFGEDVAARYDEETEGFEPAVLNPTVDFLVELVNGGAALELGIGTGRVAIPLAQRGARLRAKPGAEQIGATIGDFATTALDRTFTLAYLVCNTIMNLTTQDAQVACFRNVAAHLEPGGCFLIEVVLPDLKGEKLRIFDFSDKHVGIDEYDVAVQGLISHHYTKREGTFDYSWGPFRYVWPSELDLMAQMAGMTPRERWSGWKREPFTSVSEKLVGVWEKPAT